MKLWVAPRLSSSPVSSVFCFAVSKVKFAYIGTLCPLDTLFAFPALRYEFLSYLKILVITISRIGEDFKEFLSILHGACIDPFEEGLVGGWFSWFL